MEVLIQNFSYITWQMLVMWGIGGVLIYLAIVKQMEPTLLLPMGFGAILVNLPVSIIDAHGHNMDAHHHLRSMREGNPAFAEQLETFVRKYSLPAE